jgi:hypothetical protein
MHARRRIVVPLDHRLLDCRALVRRVCTQTDARSAAPQRRGIAVTQLFQRAGRSHASRAAFPERWLSAAQRNYFATTAMATARATAALDHASRVAFPE